MKRIAAMVVTIALSLGLCVGFVGCSAGGDTFTGVASEETYESVEDAAAYFLAYELLNVFEFEEAYVGYEKKGDLSGTEVGALNLTDAEREGLERAERGVVKYRQIVSYESEATETLSQKLYVLSYTGNVYRYYAPALSVGERITRSYLYSLMDPVKYQNCTVTVTKDETDKYGSYVRTRMTEKITESCYYGETITIDNRLQKVTKGYKEYEFTLNGKLYVTANRYSTADGKNGYDDADWSALEEEGTVSDFWLNSVSTVDGVCGGVYAPYLFKTKDGLKLNFKKYKKLGVNDGYKKFEITVKVKDGHLASYYRSVKTEMGKVVEKHTYSDFGTTEIELPQEVKDKLPSV